MRVSDIPTVVGTSTPKNFNTLAAEAATLGRAAIPALMLTARDATTSRAQLCAIKTLGMVSDPVAKEARRRSLACRLVAAVVSSCVRLPGIQSGPLTSTRTLRRDSMSCGRW